MKCEVPNCRKEIFGKIQLPRKRQAVVCEYHWNEFVEDKNKRGLAIQKKILDGNGKAFK
jgi:hypothetical protein